MVPKCFSMGRGSSLMSKAVIASSAAAALLLAIPSAHAALVIYEPYNYPSVGQDNTMTGVQTNAVGLTGAYYNLDKSLSYASSNSVTYNSSSLSLPGVLEEGGSVTDTNPSTNKPLFAAAVDSNALGGVLGGGKDGTLYGSYVFSVSSDNVPSSGTSGTGQVSGLFFGTTTVDSTTGAVTNMTADNSSPINISPISWGQQYGQVRVDGKGAAGTGVQLSANTPYLELFQFTISGGQGGTVTAAEWTLSASQYANFQGNLTASVLNAASIGTASGDVSERANANGPGNSSLSSINNMTLMSYNVNTTYDEIRLSDTSLAEAAPVPEPASLGLFAVGGLGLLLLKRRKTA